MTKSKLTTILQLPKYERPRERLAYSGAKNLTDAELLAIILGSGSTKNNVINLSKKILNQFSQNLTHLNLKKLTLIHGVGQAKATQILALVEFGQRKFGQQKLIKILSPEDAYQQSMDINTSQREHLLGLYLNARYELLSKEILAVGSVNASSVEARDVFIPAIKLPCRSIILIHNHPSGNLEPSQQDMLANSRLETAGKILGVNIIDHLIVYQNHFLSFKQKKLMS